MNQTSVDSYHKSIDHPLCDAFLSPVALFFGSRLCGCELRPTLTERHSGAADRAARSAAAAEGESGVLQSLDED